MIMMMKLNLGCGNDIRPGWINCDKYPVNHSVKKVDIDILPLPFKDNSMDLIHIEDTWEHLSVNRYDLSLELYRILKPGGKINIILPCNTESVAHTRVFYQKDYFDVFHGKHRHINEQRYNVKFKKITLKKKRNNIRNMIYKIKNFLELFFYNAYEFEMEK